ncbi:hypothetical protein PMIN02_000650 [Paraphaeosphaeria minitans]|uniref:General transcription and DNA repair factor IIH subunit TFB5 n=1 Tax=Paraphaeosphaeria minitans TaxID=565426 RepID=A0A9P6GTQ2_9PLEO|nr:RNA polymerase II transcription factor B subunit 5 [Paraphaeosphaeria minitans]
MVKAVPGVLVKCDPSIKALILNLDKEFGNQYVIEDLGDEEHLLVKNDRIQELKRRVQEEISKRIETKLDEEE